MENKPSRRILVLGDIVQDFGYVEQSGFEMVKCRSKEAYGFLQSGHAIARGLALYVRLAYYPKLCIHASHEVFDMVWSMIDGGENKAGRDLRLSARICSVDGNVMVLLVSFVASFNPDGIQSYYLVYDSDALSLSLLPSRPPLCRTIGSTLPPLKVVGGENNNYSLVLMSVILAGPLVRDVNCPIPAFCVWSPHKRPETSPWDLKRCLTLDHELFEADEAFVFWGKAVWGNLVKGIMVCDCRLLIRRTGTLPLVCNHIMLPMECMTNMDDDFLLDFDHLEDSERLCLRVRRSMGRVGDSIWFVIIQPNLRCPADTVVKVWILDFMSVNGKWMGEWMPHREFKMLELFMAEEGLPEAVPMFPMFRQQEDDGVLYVLLREPYTGGMAYAHLVGIDLSSAACEVRIRSKSRLAIPLMQHPVFLDPKFFEC